MNKKNNNKRKAIFSLIFLISLFSFNITFAAWANLWESAMSIKGLINQAQNLLATLMTVSFLYIIFNFIKRNDETSKKNLTYGLIFLTIFFTLWGIITFLKNTTFGDEVKNDLNNLSPNVTITPY